MSRGWRWQQTARAFRAHCEAINARCARCHQPIDYTLTGRNAMKPTAFTAGHIDGYAWDDLPEGDPRRCDPTYLQPECRSCGSTHGNLHRQGRTSLVTSQHW